MRRSSASDSRPTASILANTSAALSGLAWTISRPAAACTAMTLIAVGDHVVHLAGDPAALAGDGPFGFGEAVGLGRRGAAFGVDEDPFAVADEHARRDAPRRGRPAC